MVERVLGIILPVFSIIALGWLYGRRAKPDMGWVNRISMNVLAPALIFSALASKDFDIYANGLLILGGIGIVLGSGLLAWPIARWLGVDYRTFVPPMMFNNCGNMGLPLAALAFGPAGLSAMVAVFTISNLLHFTVGAWMIDHHARFGRLLQNPMVWSTIAGFRVRAPASAASGMDGKRVQARRRRAHSDDVAFARRCACSTCAGATRGSASSAASFAR
jgi:predicted permease